MYRHSVSQKRDNNNKNNNAAFKAPAYFGKSFLSFVFLTRYETSVQVLNSTEDRKYLLFQTRDIFVCRRI